jgi:hypothetical protein
MNHKKALSSVSSKFIGWIVFPSPILVFLSLFVAEVFIHIVTDSLSIRFLKQARHDRYFRYTGLIFLSYELFFESTTAGATKKKVNFELLVEGDNLKRNFRVKLELSIFIDESEGNKYQADKLNNAKVVSSNAIT